MQLLSTLEWLFCSVGSCFVQLPDFRGAFHEGCFEMACAFSPPPGSIIAVTVENSVCFRRPPVSIGMVSTSFQIGCMLIHGISTHRPDSWLTDSELCWPSCCIRKTWFRLSFHCRTPFRSVFKLSPTVRLVQFMVFRDLSPRWFLVLRVCWRQQTIVSVIRNSLSGVFHDAQAISLPLFRASKLLALQFILSDGMFPVAKPVGGTSCAVLPDDVFTTWKGDTDRP